MVRARAAPAHGLLQLTAHVVKGVAYGHINILMPTAVGHQFLTIERHVHPHLDRSPLMSMALGLLDHHPAGMQV